MYISLRTSKSKYINVQSFFIPEITHSPVELRPTCEPLLQQRLWEAAGGRRGPRPQQGCPRLCGSGFGACGSAFKLLDFGGGGWGFGVRSTGPAARSSSCERRVRAPQSEWLRSNRQLSTEPLPKNPKPGALNPKTLNAKPLNAKTPPITEKHSKTHNNTRTTRRVSGGFTSILELHIFRVFNALRV